MDNGYLSGFLGAPPTHPGLNPTGANPPNPGLGSRTTGAGGASGVPAAPSPFLPSPWPQTPSAAGFPLPPRLPTPVGNNRDMGLMMAADFHKALTDSSGRKEVSNKGNPNTAVRENLFSHGFPPMDRGGLYPSHGSIHDPLSVPLFPPKTTSAPSTTSSDPMYKHFSSLMSSSAAASYFPLHLTKSEPSATTAANAHAAWSFKMTTTTSTTTSAELSVSNNRVISNAPYVPAPASSSEENDDINEVLVDDFDGQCCRTYPFNHSRIQKWQREKLSRISKKTSGLGEPEKKATSSTQSPLAALAAISAPTEKTDGSNRSHKSKEKKGKNEQAPATTSSSIPVGIAIGRQRQQQESNSSSSSLEKRPSEYESILCPPTPSSSMMHHPHPSLGPPHHRPPWPPGPWSHHLPAPQPTPPWGFSPTGPIPMGYQLAKDPLTGQILLIPTDGAHPPPTHSPNMWSNPHLPPYGDHLAHHLGNPYGLPSASAMHHLYLQQYLHHAAAAAAHSRDYPNFPQTSSASRQLASKSKGEPETITVSDDDDDSDKNASNSASLATTSKSKEMACDLSASVANKKLTLKVPDPTKDRNAKAKSDDENSVATDLSLKQTEKSAPCSTPEPQNLKDSKTIDKNVESSTNTHSDTKSLIVKSEPSENFCADVPDQDLEDCANTLLSLRDQGFFPDDKVVEGKSGFDLLLEGIDLKKEEENNSPTALDLLCSVTREDTISLGVYMRYMNYEDLSVSMLCEVTYNDYVETLNWIDPLDQLKRQYNLHSYQSPDSAERIKEFIEKKSRQYGKESREECSADKYFGIKSLAKIIKEIRNMEIMSQLEVELREKLAQLQDSYREKQKDLSKLKNTPKKKCRKMKRGPGRPKKRKLRSVKTKMGRPRKRPVATPNKELDEETNEEYEDEDDNESDEDLPPVLEPCVDPISKSPNSSSPSYFRPSASTNEKEEPLSEKQLRSSGNIGLLKPPKLTASFTTSASATTTSTLSVLSNSGDSKSGSVTNLSTISAKFMKGKANPFANLMKLASSEISSSSITKRKSPLPKPSLDDVTEEEEVDTDAEENENEAGDEMDDDDERASSATPTSSPPKLASAISYSASSPQEAVCSKRSSSALGDHADLSVNKRRKSENPRKHFGTTETIVPKKPRNLFMMNCLELRRGFGDKSENRNQRADEYEFDEDDDDESDFEENDRNRIFGSFRKAQQNKNKTLKPATSKDSHQMSEEKSTVKEESAAKEPPKDIKKEKNEENSSQPLGLSSTLSENDLKNEQQILILQEGRFWPAKVFTTQLDGVFNVVIDKTRHNKPIIMAREDLMKEAVLDVKPNSRADLPIGTRVCVYWSQLYNCLFPGTVEQIDCPIRENMIPVVLDDGDRRQVDFSNVRLLPPDYSKVVYDPDPIASLRKRRVSSDSMDSGTGERYGFLQQRPPPIAPLTSYMAATSQEMPGSSKRKNSTSGNTVSNSSPKKTRKHKKKKKHHHCKHKNKKRNKSASGNSETGSLKIKLDGSFNNTTTYSIRSPSVYQTRSEESTMEEDETSDSDEESSYSTDDESQTAKKASRALKAGLNPVTGRPLWTWMTGDEGYRRPGSKGKAKKLFHRAIQRGDEVLHVGDCAVFLSTARVDRPYIGKVELLWETWNGNMMVKVKWFYHPEEIETNSKKFDLKLPGGLFQSPHTDENDVQTISHKCNVLPLKEYSRIMTSENSNSKRKKSSNLSDTYYLAGSYDPTVMSVSFQTGVLKQ